jgi:hypothetical protein
MQELESPKNSISTDATGLDPVLTALGLTFDERLTYEYLFLFGPANGARAKEGVHFPEGLTVDSFNTSAKSLVREGFATVESGAYNTTGLDFLIVKTSKKPELKELHDELVSWKELSTEKSGIKSF